MNRINSSVVKYVPLPSGTFRLFARPSFLEGIARLVDLGGTLQIYNGNRTPQEADWLSLQSDWHMVGHDIREAIIEFEERVS